jgi:hypothetical protein
VDETEPAATNTATTIVDEAAAASPNTTTSSSSGISSSCVYDMYPSSRCCSDSAADIPYDSCSLQQQPELADAAAEEHVTCRIQVASAATAKAAATKGKLPLSQTADCDTAAALAGLADNMQLHPKRRHSLPAAAVQVVSGVGEVGGKQSGWLRHVCSRLFVCVAAGSFVKADGLL